MARAREIEGKFYKEIDVAELQKEKVFHEKSIKGYEEKIKLHQAEIDKLDEILPGN